jgi:hypothetical protein
MLPSNWVDHASVWTRRLPRMLFALSEAWQTTLALVGLFGVLFPALVTGLIVFAVAQAAAERQQNLERRQGARR